MTTLTYAARDARTMLRRNLKHALRYPSMTISVVAMPVLMLLLFTYVFGGALRTVSAGRPAAAPTTSTMWPRHHPHGRDLGRPGHRGRRLFRYDRGHRQPLPHHGDIRASFLTGHVVGSVLQTLVSIAFVIGVALLMGFRPHATPLGWLAAAGLLTLLTLALTWLSAAIGLVAKNVETASNIPLPMQFLPFLGSAIVPRSPCPPGCAGSPSTSPSPRSSRPCAAC